MNQQDKETKQNSVSILLVDLRREGQITGDVEVREQSHLEIHLLRNLRGQSVAWRRPDPLLW
jgi:hypothetical protein